MQRSAMPNSLDSQVVLVPSDSATNNILKMASANEQMPQNGALGADNSMSQTQKSNENMSSGHLSAVSHFFSRRRSANKSSKKKYTDPEVVRQKEESARLAKRTQMVSLVWGLLGYMLCFACFGPVFGKILYLYEHRTPAVEDVALNLQVRLQTLSEYNNTELTSRFAENVSRIFVNSTLTANETIAETKRALVGLATKLSVESVVPRLTAAAVAAQFSAQGNTSTALAAVTEVVVNMLGDPDAFVLSVETDMAEFADFDTDQDAAAALLPRALGSPFFLALGLGAVEIVDQVAAAFLDESREVALNEMFLLSWASFVASEVVVILLTMMVYSNRDQAEIRSRHKYFYIHFLFGALILPFAAIFFVGVALFQFTYDPDINAALFTTATSLMAIVGIMFVLVPFTYRQRFMYVVFKVRKFRYQSYYFVLLPYHIGLTLVVIAGHLWCYYDHDSCTVYYDYVFITFAIVAILIEFVYYSYRLGTQTYTTLIFVDSWQAARLIFLWGTSYAVGYAYTGWRNSEMLSALWISWQLIILTTGAVLDYFLLLSLKAFTRRNGYDFITELNMAGNANQMVDLDDISVLLDDPELRTLFVEFTEYRHCSEMPKFLVCMREVERRYRATDDEHVRVCEIDEAIRRITAEFVTPAVLNIAGEVQALLVHNLSELYGVSVTRRYTSSVSADFVLNTDSYQSHQAINFPAEGPPPDTDWDEVLDWFRPAYHQIQTILRMSVLPVFRQSPQLMQILENRHAQQDALQRDGVLHATTPAFNMSERVRYIANTEIVRANSSDGSASNRRSERGRQLLGDSEGSTRTFEAVPRAALGAVDTKGECLSSGQKTGRAPVLQRGTSTSMMAIDSDLAGSGRHDVYNRPAAGTSSCKPLKPGNSPGQQAALQANSVLDVDGGGLFMNLNGPQSLHRSMSSDRTTQSDRNTHAYEYGQNPYTPKYLHMRTFTCGDADSSVETHKPTSRTKDM